MAYRFQGIDHVQLAAPAGSEQKAREFFADLLGMEEIEKPETLKKNGGIWFLCGAQQLHIGVEQPFDPARKAHPAFYVENLVELKSNLKSSHVKVTEDDRLPGYKRFYLDDPFGNRLEFLEKLS
ncbi:glyoxalase [Sediminibacillus dalangtanensis]|uniref:Glyoxalase n=1 Tax=Sediminibacillus dalangtanensis TaxID=2729421 RepID=A0ABX7VSU1_9BACI|nr:VOC family protein [Sediminibacillus dalangtanensis]QTM99588.1 glyoxalase [Sediminibacillus dalangtanensis]